MHFSFFNLSCSQYAKGKVKQTKKSIQSKLDIDYSFIYQNNSFESIKNG